MQGLRLYTCAHVNTSCQRIGARRRCGADTLHHSLAPSLACSLARPSSPFPRCGRRAGAWRRRGDGRRRGRQLDQGLVLHGRLLLSPHRPGPGLLAGRAGGPEVGLSLEGAVAGGRQVCGDSCLAAAGAELARAWRRQHTQEGTGQQRPPGGRDRAAVQWLLRLRLLGCRAGSAGLHRPSLRTPAPAGSALLASCGPARPAHAMGGSGGGLAAAAGDEKRTRLPVGPATVAGGRAGRRPL
jgi:hypothetical protein